LCCGTFYEVDGDCPNVDKVEHSSGLAYVVALRLQRRGLELPTPEQVREALPD
jgi:hypothetical protein